MSHIPERTEKDCLNCGATVYGKYCHVCGQENVVPHETFWHMLKHFFFDITHFDSKFFVTVKDLLFKPGFLSKEYVKGRRASYLNPIKMYVFTSAVFFLLFFSFFNSNSNIKTNLDADLTKEEIRAVIKEVDEKLKLDTADVNTKELFRLLRDTTQKIKKADLVKYWEDYNVITINGNNYKTLGEYDSAQAALPSSERDNWLEKKMIKKVITVNEKYRDDPMNAFNKLRDGFLHKLPYLLFISLPLFALSLRLLYIRRKEFYYFDHGIFSIHHYIFTFILLLFVFSLQKLNNVSGWDVFGIISVILFLSGGFYLYKAMRNFYRQRRMKTIVKFLLLNLMGFIGMVILFCLFVIFSVFEL